VQSGFSAFLAEHPAQEAMKEFYHFFGKIQIEL
jgi:hypothetical protein